MSPQSSLTGALVAGALLASASPAGAVTGPDRCPGPYQRGSYEDATPQRLGAVRAGNISILGQPAVRLVPPIDWRQDPYRSESWISKLHAMEWMDPLLAAYSRTHNRGALLQARDAMLDWARGNPPFEGSGWSDKVTGERAVLLAYVTAASECAGILTEQQRSTLRTLATNHGRFLADPRNYKAGNHGLFVDQGLLVLTGYLPTLPQAARWRALAARRFRTALPVSRAEGVELEHSPGYHFLVLNQIDNVLGLPGGTDPAVRSAVLRMRRVAPWFVMPDGIITRLGDTALKRAPLWAIRAAARLRGIAPTLRTGFGIVRQGRSYLSVADGYHPYGHKQADELTFELFDRGRHIVTDTGRYGAARDDKDPAKVGALNFTKSSQAHSGLVVDGLSYPFEQYRPYGSGLRASGSGAGWWAIQGVNPLVTRQGVAHSRLFLYRPGQALVVVDRVAAARQHEYTRYFQFHPGMTVTTAADGRTNLLRAGGFSGSLYTAPTPGDVGGRVVVGQADPLLGFTTSENKFAPFVRRAAVAYTTRAASATYVAVISLAGPATATLQGSSATSVAVRLAQAGRAPVRVTAVRVGSRLRVSAAGG